MARNAKSKSKKSNSKIKSTAKGNRVNYSFPISDYQLPSALVENYKKKQLLAEYRALRIEAQARLRAFQGTKYEGSYAYQTNKHFLTGATSPYKLNKRQLATGLTELSGFLESKTSTLSGTRAMTKKAINTFKDRWGMNWLNAGNYEEFTKFLEFARELKGQRYIFEEVVALYRSAKYSKIPLDRVKSNFDFYLNQIDITDDPNTTRQYLRRDPSKRKSAETVRGKMR